MANPNASIQISFSEAADDDSSSGDNGSISLSLDTDKNTEYYGEAKTTFAPGEAVYLKAIVSPKTADITEIKQSVGVVTKAAHNLPFDVDENISFNDTKEESLRYYPEGAINWEYLGAPSSAYSPYFNGQTVKIAVAAVAVLHCEYIALYDRLKLLIVDSDMNGASELPVTVMIFSGAISASLVVNYAVAAGTSSEYKTYNLNTTSLCAEGVIAGATVTQNGNTIGVTDTSGNLTFSSWTGTYTFEVTADGYTTVSREATLT